ncbi:nucleotidyltransferase domain-containing protein [Puteibacter caeruleilacunae]|nr:nucleotidyltransferase domain-containing protein [Puteibacter caeruleilacunae]
MERKEILLLIKRDIKKVEPNADIILYGSEARGDSSSDSDIDLLILVDKENLSYQDKAVISDPLYHIELQTGVQISPIIYTHTQWNNRPFKTPFYINVMNEGVSL